MSDTVARRGVVAVIVRDQQFLVIHRSQHVAAPGMICFPGGGIEPGESEQQALIRELREELNVDVQPTQHLWRSTTPWNVALSWWLTALDADQRIEPNPAEVAAIQWVSMAEMERLPTLLESNRHFLTALRGGVFTLG